MKNDNGMAWSFFGVWNDSLLVRKEREMTARDYIWASELGGSHIDRWLKMKGTTPTNPPNARSLRKFQAGNIWEWLIGHVLTRAGILIDGQEHLKYQYDGLLEVTGKLDFLAGGKPDWDNAIKSVYELKLPDMLHSAAIAIIGQLRAKYGNELRTIVLEVKSCSSFMFDRYERVGKANPHHVMQLYHYLKAKGLPEGHIVYICKDDCRMIELPVWLDHEETEQMYKSDIAAMTEYIKTNTEPAKEQEIVFTPDLGKFSKNWKVEYSNYLTMLYGYSEPEAYRARWDGKVSQFNRTFKRVIDGANMTKLNLEVIEEMKAYFPNYDAMVAETLELKAKGVVPETEEAEDAIA